MKKRPQTVDELRDLLDTLESGSWGMSTKTERSAVILFFAERLLNIEKSLAKRGTDRDRYKKALEEILGDVGKMAAHPIARIALERPEERDLEPAK